MNYDNWDGQDGSEVGCDVDYDSDMVSAAVGQNLPLTFPFAKAFSRHLWEEGSVASVPRTLPKKNKTTGEWHDETIVLEYHALPISTEAMMENHALHYLKTSP